MFAVVWPPQSAPTSGREKRQCLRRRLPKQFSSGRYGEVDAALHDCLGSRGKEIAASGADGLRFGRDGATGLGLEVRIFCADLCPEYTKASIVYTGVASRDECLCLRGRPLLLPLFGDYVGCAPARSDAGAHFVAERDFTAWFDGRKRTVRVFGGLPGSAMAVTGLHQGAEVLRIDGHDVDDVEDVRRVVERMPRDPPAGFTIRTSDRGREFVNEIHYVSRATIAELAKAVAELRRVHAPPTECAEDAPVVSLDGDRVCVDVSSGDDWAALAGTIEVLATAPPAAEEPLSARTPEFCRAFSTVPTVVRLERESGALELRSIDWM